MIPGKGHPEAACKGVRYGEPPEDVFGDLGRPAEVAVHHGRMVAPVLRYASRYSERGDRERDGTRSLEGVGQPKRLPVLANLLFDRTVKYTVARPGAGKFGHTCEPTLANMQMRSATMHGHRALYPKCAGGHDRQGTAH